MSCRMIQRSICLFVDRQKFSASDIHGQFVAIIDSDTIVYSIIIKYLRVTRFTEDKQLTTQLDGPDVIDQIILIVFDEYIFLSV
jgi:hypothetical protein